VFFRTFRAPEYRSEWVDSLGSYFVQVDIPAEPFAYGLREDVGAVTVTNDPAAGSNGMFLDVSSVKGDAATPAIVWVSESDAGGVAFTGILASEAPPGVSIYFSQTEAATMLTDTSVQANNASFSGAGSNWVRCTFATDATLVARFRSVSFSVDMPAGLYRCFARVRSSSGTSDTYKMQVGVTSRSTLSSTAYDYVNSVSSVTTTNQDFEHVDLGLVTLGVGQDLRVGYGNVATPGLPTLAIKAQRVTGAASLDIDYVLLLPASKSLAFFTTVANSTAAIAVLDAVSDSIYWVRTGAGAPFTNPILLNAFTSSFVGGLPELNPGVTNRLHLVQDGAISLTTAVNVSYWPRYLTVRPT
jgi:hypothetical protein